MDIYVAVGAIGLLFGLAFWVKRLWRQERALQETLLLGGFAGSASPQDGPDLPSVRFLLQDLARAQRCTASSAEARPFHTLIASRNPVRLAIRSWIYRKQS